jgi:hypothetical protein
MKKLIIPLTIVTLALPCVAYSQDSIMPKPKSLCLREFKKAGFDTDHYEWSNSQAHGYLLKANNNFKISDGLLAGGLASGVVGSTAIVVGALNVRLSQSVDRIHVPLICGGLGLNLVALPVFFIMRDVVDKRAARNIQIAQRMLNP